MKTKPIKIYRSCPKEESMEEKKFKLHPLMILKSLYLCSLEDIKLDQDSKNRSRVRTNSMNRVIHDNLNQIFQCW